MGVGDQCNSSVEWALGISVTLRWIGCLEPTEWPPRNFFFFLWAGLQRECTGQNREHLMNNKYEILSPISVLTSEGKMLSLVFFMLLKYL